MIKIEVTGDNAEQVFAQLRGLVGQQDREPARGVVFEEAAAPADDKPKRTRKGNAAPIAETTTVATPAEPEEATTAGTTTSDAPAAAVELVWETDVAPAVLSAVQKAGKPAVEALLEQFGVERASQLDAALWPELIQRLGDL